MSSALCLAFSAAAMVAASAEAPSQLLFRPDIHGDRVVFTSEGDLWLGSIANRTASRITSGDGVEGPARFSPDGRSIAFTAHYDGGTDVYLTDVAGGMPRRLTWDPSGATVQGWTPDGRNVIFRSKRSGGTWRNRLWTVPVAGGSPRLLPVPYGEFASMGPDGKRLAYVPVSAEWQHWKRYRGGNADDIWLADLESGTFRRLTTDPHIDTEPVWVGDQIYFVSDPDGHANLYRCDPGTGAIAQATRFTDFDVRYPGTDGARVVFEHGTGLALYDPAGDRTEELRFELHSDRIHAREKRVPALTNLFGVAFGPTGRRILVSARGQILSTPVEEGDVRPLAAVPGSRCQYPAWSADGKQVAYVSDGSGEEQIYVVPSIGGAARQVTRDHKGPLGPLTWSPDGRWIATSDREMRILLVDVATGSMTTVAQADRGGSYDIVLSSYRFSPDGKWLAYARLEPNWNTVVYLYDISGRKSVAVTTPEMGSYAPAFDPDGKYLYFLSDRVFNARYTNTNRFFSFDKVTKVSLVTLAADEKSPFLTANEQEGLPPDSVAGGEEERREAKRDKEKSWDKATVLPRMKVDTEGIGERIVEVPVPADTYTRVEPLEGRILLAALGNREAAGPFPTPLQLRSFDIKRKEVRVVVDSLTDFQISADHEKMLLQIHQGFTVVGAATETFTLEDKSNIRIDTNPWIVQVDPPAEWGQIYRETWRVGRDFFYDPAMHGVDWAAAGKKYEALLPSIADRSDLNYLLGELIAELNCGHAYVGGGDLPAGARLPMGYLGADFEPVAGSTPAYRVTKIYPGDGFDLQARSPLLAPGIDVEPGDYILAVAGRPVRADQDIQAMLAGTANQQITLTVNSSASMDGAREVLIRPMGNESTARYYDWAAGRAAYVRERGGGNFGYLHIPDMGGGGLREFGKHYYANLTKDAMIYDVRFNGGGYIDGMILLQMSSKPYTYFKPRYGASWTRQDWAFAGHSAALVNDQSYSDAEEFCDSFQRLKMGPVIGVRSWGGEVGSGGGYPLLDGGAVYIPNYGEWSPDGKWLIEGTGVIPDMVVEDDPAGVMAGRDPQLDRAIEYLKQKLLAEPVARPTPPPFPVKANRGSDTGAR
jgi:tricorn protease